MSKHFGILSLIFIALSIGACNKDDDGSDLIGNWVKASDFEGVPRSDAASFVIGSKAYVGTGYDGDDRLNDFWEYDPDKDFWQQKANFPGVARNGAVAFGTDSKGYIGTGYDGFDKLNDFWEYNPTTNTWLKKAEFAGNARYGAVAFSIANKGYIGTGYDGNNTLKDFWQYNPETDAWAQIVSIGGSKRRDALAFVNEGIAYIATGINNGTYVSDMWAYNPANETWTQKRNIANISDDTYDDSYDIAGINGVAFTMDSKSYIAACGKGTVGETIWEYSPSTDLWEQKVSLEGSARTEAVAFSVNDRGFFVSGRNSGYYFDDLWEFHPNEEYDKND